METVLSPLEFARRARAIHAHREAVIDGDRRFTYAQFFDRVDRWSHALQRLGIGHGERVAYIAPNTHAHLEGYYAVPQIGAIIVPLNYRLRALHWIAPGRSFTRYERRFRERVGFGSVLLFQLALPSEIPGYVLGIVRYPLGKYLAALAIVEVPYAVGTMLIGASFVSRDVGMLVALGVTAVVAVVVLARLLRRHLS